MLIFLLPLIAVALIIAPIVYVVKGKITGKKAKNAFLFNLCSFNISAKLEIKFTPIQNPLPLKSATFIFPSK